MNNIHKYTQIYTNIHKYSRNIKELIILCKFKEHILNYLMYHLDKIVALSIIFIATLLLRQAIIMCGQKWIRTFSHTATLILLPMITYTITSVISGNIALSLGMVGALSIIRFRNPVKSPFELVVYFLVITLGIAASVSLSWFVFLVSASFTVLGIIVCIKQGIFFL